MFGNKCKCRCGELKPLLEDHEKQHTKEHYIVIVLLAAVIALQVANYVWS